VAVRILPPRTGTTDPNHHDAAAIDQPLHAVVRRVHAVRLPQRFAIDALSLVDTPPGKRLASWLLRHYRRYLRGAIDPDVRFRDFHNHILHVREGGWGGAPRVAHRWYQGLQKFLYSERFDRAAYAAGVLSHYVSDVMQPQHTASTDHEALIHRPLEWSIECCYDQILSHWTADEFRVVMQVPDHPHWLGSLMTHAARFAEQRFDPLVQRYRFQDGIRDPKAGLDDASIRLLAETFGITMTGWARVLERAAADAEAFSEAPLIAARPLLAMPGAVARIPLAACGRGVHLWRESEAVERLADEYFRTGRLNRRLPAEVDIKRRVIEVRRRERSHLAPASAAVGRAA